MSAVPQIVKSLSKEVAPALPQFMEQPGLFSKIADVTRRLNFSKMDSRQLNKTLMGKGVTSDEIADTLGGLSGTVSKQQVLDRIGERGVRTEDVVLGEPRRMLDKEVESVWDSTKHPDARSWDELPLTDRVSFTESAKRATIVPTHYEKWTLPGAKEGSYREMFVTVPSLARRGAPTWEEYKAYFSHDPRITRDSYDFDLSRNLWPSGLLGTTKGKPAAWRDGHLGYEDIENPIVRIRFNDRIVDHPEKKQKVLFVEEIQGPQGDQKYVIDGADKAGTWDTKQEAVDAAKKLRLDPSRVTRVIEGEQGYMPPALQKRIYDIGVKRIIAYAKEHGYDGVAWTPGKMQADRYNLAKQIDSLRITKFPSGTYHIGASKGNTPLLVEEGVSESDLPRYIGKELAGKAITQLGNKNTGQVLFEGLDLEIGGEGLKDLYDTRIASLFKKYGKGDIGIIKLRRDPGAGDGYINPDYYIRIGESISGIRDLISTQGLRAIKQRHGLNAVKNAIKLRAKDIDESKLNLTAEQSARLAFMRDGEFELIGTKPIETEVPFIPITKDTPSRFPLYSIPPALLTAGFGAKEFGPEYFSNKRAARMRQS